MASFFTPFRWHPVFALVFLCALFVPAGIARANDNRYLLASQDDWGAKRGFYLETECSAPGDAPCRLADMTLALGAADGQGWHFVVLHGPWQTNHLYQVAATVGPTESQISLDGGTPQRMPNGFVPDTSPLLAHQMPPWAMGAADFTVRQTALQITPSGAGAGAGKGLSQTWPAGAGDAGVALLAGAPPSPLTTPLALAPNITLTIHAAFEFVPKPTDPAAELKALSPLVDRWGQAVGAHWRGKVTDDADLKADIAEEAAQDHYWPLPKDRDPFGGVTDLGWNAPATGYFSLTRHAGKWWLITPLGHPCFYTGLDTVPDIPWGGTPVTGREFEFAALPPRDGPDAATWSSNAWGDSGHVDYVSFVDANLIRKYGPDWQKAADASAAARVKTWGFSGMGKWSSGPSGAFAATPSIPVLSRSGVPTLAGHPDIFDPAVQTALRDTLSRQITPQITNPNVVAWSLGNEYDEIVTPGEVKKILAMPDTVPARQALYAQAQSALYHGDAAARDAAWKSGPPDADVEALRQFYESKYYAFLYHTVKAIDPHHLYAGYWPSIGWWVGPQDFSLLAPSCDLIGYDRYNPQFADASFQKLINDTGKPILCGEFSFPPFYAGARGYGQYGTFAEDEADAGRLYARWVADAAAEPNCVGVCWFEYRDEPISGRGPGSGPQPAIGEHYAFGMVDDSDRPKWPLVSAVRAANLAAAKERMGAGQANL